MLLFSLPLLLACPTPDADTAEPLDSDSSSETDIPETDSETATDSPIETDPPPDTDSAGPSPTIALGTGSQSFTALAELDPVTMVYGPQGGFHMLGAARVCHLASPVDVRFTIVDEPSGIGVGDARHYGVVLLPDGPNCGLALDLFGYLDARNISDGETTDPTGYVSDHVVLWTLTLTDPSGASASGSLRLTAVDE